MRCGVGRVSGFVLGWLVLWGVQPLLDARAQAVRPPVDTLVPATTKAFVSIADPVSFKSHWEATQFGAMGRDPILRPFLDDLKRQVQDRLTQSDSRLGLDWSDLQGVAGGELGLAMVQPGNVRDKHAVVVVVDVRGHVDRAQAALAKADKNLLARKAKKGTGQVAGVPITTYLVPPAEGRSRPVKACHCLYDEWLLAADDEAILGGVLQRLQGQAGGHLAQSAVYQESLRRALEGLPVDVRFFVDPIGYAQVLQASGDKVPKRDMVQVFEQEGFDVLSGLAGGINFHMDGHEALFRGYLLANAKGGLDAARGSARALRNLPNTTALEPPTFVPDDVANCARVSWQLKEAFDVAGSLVDALQDDPGLWEDILESLRTERNGPNVDIKAELVAHLAERAYMISKPRFPVQIDSEQRLYAFELGDAQAAQRTVDRVMGRDPTVTKAPPIPGLDATIWVVDEAKARAPAAGTGAGGQRNGFGFGQPRGGRPQRAQQRKGLNSGAVTVFGNYLLYATDAVYLQSVLQHAGGKLAGAADFQQIEQTLARIGAESDCLRYFTRLDQSQHVNYELLRQGKMPQAKTILGNFLNELLKPEEKGVARQQQIDGKNLPPYEKVSPYLGPGGLFVRSERDGWYIGGFFAPPSTGRVVAARLP